MQKIKLRAPEGATSVSHGGIEYEVTRGALEVPHESIARELMETHGFVAWDEPAKPEEDEDREKDEFDKMSRAELFAYLKAQGVAALPSHKDVALRGMAREAKAKTEAKAEGA